MVYPSFSTVFAMGLILPLRQQPLLLQLLNMSLAHFLNILPQHLSVKGSCGLPISSFLKPVVPVSIVQGVGPIVSGEVERR
jgi:hypothetical protein